MSGHENHPVYVNQRLKLQRTFSGKSEQIANQIRQFQQEVAPPRSSTKQWEKDVIAEDELVQIISNWASFDVLQYQDNPGSAGMSMIHLLAIPRDLIVNGVYLTTANVDIIDDMIDLFEEAWKDGEKRQKVLDLQLEAINRRFERTKGESFAEQAHQAALEHHAWLKSNIDQPHSKDFYYRLHLRPDNSADYLHLHIIAAPYGYRKYSTSGHDIKTKDAFEVRDFIKRDAQQNPGAT
ncbi:hypothetical protein KJ359_010381 [Pestalotiopsis sp. 9143b]|nr:hypothetical protein KJ359_010381 [Pestalotiopsis sp. 9143b]